ncbi:NAD(P)/FAD-dependent oxidoreductase [Glaciibacter psychrotolerans]|uniref:3-phenylpropionate/trans-cinnamate dioxygenase ferredoxin reductase subunit n=1 Tax=Glaciibacter psychrotolerans TaxID=670054 RepID=A0A7Z0J4N3_9MICO|nr:FAD-dependent oxidoreductase [Leifsonia psychrotolerans]NYJ18261.1 3-phenylpropionate/trans-cinnamate dioxygenase ferredoxin reductase subunit [Leifsonia psychrotolerans]
MSTDQTFVIVGGGLAGARAAEGMRTEGFEGRIVLLAEEDEIPYIRPPLSKEFLTGAMERDGTRVHPPEWYTENRVELRRGASATALARSAHDVTLSTGETLRYDKLLLATGASPRRFPGPGVDLIGVHHLRSVAESAHLREWLEPGLRTVVIIGAGWIGLEVASAAIGYGNVVTVLGLETVPLNIALGDEAGAVFGQLHRDNGVDLRMQTGVSEILGDSNGVTGVRLKDGEVIPAEVVVVGIGAIPNVSLATDAGLRVGNGIVVDSAFRTDDPDIFAVGDVANVFHPVLGHGIRIEHWANAENAGREAGRSMAGAEINYDAIPYFYTDQFDLGMEYSGYADLTKGATVVFRGDLAARRFIAFWVADNRVVAGMNVNVWDVNETVQRLIRTGVQVDHAALADESIALEDLLASTTG